MFTQFFGQFLLNNNYISAEELKKVFKNIKNTRLRLGMIAINEGFLTSKQVVEINNLQKKQDKRFGEVAIEINYLNENELNTILTKQQSEHLILAETIVNQGFMTIEEFSSALAEYKEKNCISDESFDELKNGKIDEVIYNMIKIDDFEIKEYIALFYKNIVRFITNDVYISESIKVNEKQFKYLFEQNIVNEKSLYTAFSIKDNDLLLFSSKYSGEKIEIIDEFAIDVCKEFINLHNGLFTVNMSNKGKKCDLDIPVCKENHILKGKDIYIIPFHTGVGELELIIVK